MQNLFLGQAILDVKNKKQNIALEKNAYVLSPKTQATLFDAFFVVHPGHFKLNQQSILNTLKNQRLDIKYTSYKLVDDEIIPQQINIIVKQENKLTIIDFILRSIELNTKINTSFTIPNGYKRMNL